MGIAHRGADVRFGDHAFSGILRCTKGSYSKGRSAAAGDRSANGRSHDTWIAVQGGAGLPECAEGVAADRNGWNGCGAATELGSRSPWLVAPTESDQGMAGG